MIDYNHWPRMGDFKFDPISWPDVPGMMNNLTKTYNIPEVKRSHSHRHTQAQATEAQAETPLLPTTILIHSWLNTT